MLTQNKLKKQLKTLFQTVQSYYPDVSLKSIETAATLAQKAHQGQKRASGEPYLIHPLHVAQILADLKLDVPSILTGLLHDTVEDTSITLEQIQTTCGKTVSQLVDGVTKLSKLTFRTTEEKQAENFRKMIIAMAKDIRVILVKLADRLDNMRTLKFLPISKQKIIAQETLDIYAPIANRLGMSSFRTELEDLCLRFLHSETYYKISEKITKTKKERYSYIEKVCDILREKLKDYDIKAQVNGRAKHIYSIFRKMERRNAEFEQIYDLIAFRIITENITECYKALGVIHSSYKPIPGRFKDYIAMPKANSYQSLHTSVIGPFGERVEIQIRTIEMHEISEKGIAAHWKYKEGKFNQQTKENLDWVQRLLEWQKDLSDPNEFLEAVKIDLFQDEVFVFTPKGSVLKLPYGSTPIDFAYAIHTDIGHRCIGAKINGKLIPLKHRLKSGDTVEILTSKSQTPSKDWLKCVRSSKAKTKIRTFIKTQERQRALDLGRELLETALRKHHSSFKKIERTENFEKTLQKLSVRSEEELLIRLGYGHLTADHFLKEYIFPDEKNLVPEKIPLLKKIIPSSKNKFEPHRAILVEEMEDILIRFARCCHPIPGDPIIGFITRGRGVTIHTATCAKALDMDSARRVDAQWTPKKKHHTTHHAHIKVLCTDTPGLLAQMSQSISKHGINISSANIRTTKDKKAICMFEVLVQDRAQLEKMMTAIEAKKGVIAVERVKS